MKKPTTPRARAMALARAILREDKSQGPYMQNLSPAYLAGLLQKAAAKCS